MRPGGGVINSRRVHEQSAATGAQIAPMHTFREMEAAQSAIPLPVLPESESAGLAEWQAAPSAGHRSAFDYAAALENVGGEAELLAQIARAFCVSFHGLRGRLREGIERRESQTVRILAHTLKGGLLQFASVRATTVAQELEEAAANRDWPAVQMAVESLEFELGRLLPELAALAAVGEAEPAK